MNELKKRLRLFHSEYIQPSLVHPNRKPSLQQAVEIFRLMLQTGYWPQNYFKYQAYLTGVKPSEASRYIPGDLYAKLSKECLNDSNYVLQVEDKLLFNRLIKSHQLPGTTLLAYFLAGDGFYTNNNEKLSNRELQELLSNGFAAKPAFGTSNGQGVEIIKRQAGDEAFRDRRHDYLNTIVNQGNKFIFEALIRQHDTMAAIYPHSVNTIRIDTMRTVTGEILINSAYARFGKNGRAVDNWTGAEAGIAVKVDLSTGTLAATGVDYRLNRYQCHPNSKATFANITVPFWTQIMVNIKNAAKIFPEVNSLGWDVAIGQQGPIIVEANSTYGMQAMQTGANKAYFEDPNFVNAVIEHIKRKGMSQYLKYFKPPPMIPGTEHTGEPG